MPDYPSSDVTPLLIDSTTPCNSALPGGEVVEWFDFGQFVELVATDSAGVSHPVVLTNKERLARVAGEVNNSQDVPLRIVDVLGGIPLSDLATGKGEDALKPLASSLSITVSDIDALIQTGSVVEAGVTYHVTLTRQQALAIADGETLPLIGTFEDGGVPREERLTLIPQVLEFEVTDVNSVIAALSVTISGDVITLELESTEVAAILAGISIVVRGKFEGHTRLVRLKQTISVPLRHPAQDQVTIDDLPAFLANPQVEGADGLPLSVPLKPDDVGKLRQYQKVSIVFPDNSPLTITPVRPALKALLLKRDTSGGVSIDDSSDGGKGSGAKSPPGSAPITLLTQNSPSATARVNTFPQGPDLGPFWSSFMQGEKPLPPPKPPVPDIVYSLQVALFLPWRQVWTLKGLSRGRLLHSLSLSPQEETTIELQTWEKRKKTLDQSTQTDTTQSIEGTDTTKDTTEAYDQVQKQSDFQWQVGGSLRATYRTVAAEVGIDASASAKASNSVNEVGRTSQQRIHEAVIKSTTTVRTQRVTKITESVESGSEQRVTRHIKNPNMCHTLNLDYYEVLAAYDITTRFLGDEAKICAMISNPISFPTFYEDTVRQNETALRNGLLDRALDEGFDSIRYLAGYDWAKWELAERKKAAAQAVNSVAPVTKQDPATNTTPTLTKQETDVLSALEGFVAACKDFSSTNNDPKDLLDLIADHGQITNEARQNGRRWLFVMLVNEKFPNFADTMRAASSSSRTDLQSSSPSATRLSAARSLLTSIPPATGNPTLAGLNDLSDGEKENAGIAAEIESRAKWFGDKPWWFGRCKEEQLYLVDDMGVPATAQRLLEKLQALDAAPTVADQAGATGSAMVAAAGTQQDQQSAEDVLESKFALEEVGHARERSNTLLAHLNVHMDYYRFVLFQALPPSEQLDKLLKGSGGALRVGMFEPRVVSMHGSLLAVPLFDSSDADIDQFKLNMIDKMKEAQDLTNTVLLPTPGMTIESRLGRCSTCEEFIEKGREIELRRLEALAEQEEQEADRRRKRLAAASPNLDPFRPEPSAVSVRLTNDAQN